MTQPGTGPLGDHIHRLATAAAISALTDGDCLGRFAVSGDQAAFETLVGRHGPAVLRIGRAVLGDPTAAEDVFQATFLVLARRAGTLRKRPSVASWLRRVAFRIALRHRRNDRERASREEAALPRPPADPLDEAGGREVRAIVFEEIARLSERYREPLLLCGIEGLSRDEAARQLGCDPGTLKSRLERGRRILRHRLAQRGLKVSAGLVTAQLSGAAGEAAVPAALAAATLRAGVAVRGNRPVAGLVSDRVAGLYARAARSAFLEKLNTRASLLLLGIALVAGGGLLLRSRMPDTPAADSANARADAPQELAADQPGPLRPGGATIPVSAKFTPDGKTLVYSGPNGIRTWALRSSDQLLNVIPRAIAGGQSDVLLSPDGKSFFTANDAGIREWELATAKVLRSLRTTKYSRAHLSPDGKLIAALVPGAPERLEVLAVASGDVLWSKELGEMPMNGVAFSPDGRTVVLDGWASRGSPPLPDNAVRFFDARTGAEGKRIDLGARVPFKTALSPDGSRLAVIYWGENPDKPVDRPLSVFDPASGEELLRIDPPGSKILTGHNYFSALVFAPNGRSLITSGGGGGLIEWDLASGQQLRQFARDTMSADSLTVSADGKTLAVAGAGSIVRLVDRATGEYSPSWFQGKAPLRKGTTTYATYGNNGKPVTTAGPGSAVVVWDPATDQLKARFGSGSPTCWYSLPRGGGMIPFAIGEYSGNANNPRDSGTDEDPSRSSGKSLDEVPDWWAVSLDGKTIAAKDYSSDTFHLFDAISGKLLKSLRDPGFAACKGTLTRDGRTLFAFSPDRTVQVWDVVAASRARQLGPLGDLLPTGPGGVPKMVVNNSTRRFVQPQRGTVADVNYATSVSPDGSRIAVGDEAGNVYLVNVATGQYAWRFTSHASGIETILTFSPDARNLAYRDGGQGPTLVLEVATGLQRCTYWVTSTPARTLAFSPDGKTLICCGGLGRAFLFDLTGRSADGTGSRGSLSTAEMDACWASLAGADAAAAFSSVQRLTASDGTVAYLRERLRPAAAADVDLFANRVRVAPGDDLRNVRAVEVLEWIGDRPARELLERLARGFPEAGCTREAKGSLDRLKRLEISTSTDRSGR